MISSTTKNHKTLFTSLLRIYFFIFNRGIKYYIPATLAEPDVVGICILYSLIVSSWGIFC